MVPTPPPTPETTPTTRPTDDDPTAWRQRELRAENAYVAHLYDRLDAQRDLASGHLHDVHLHERGGTHQARLDRDVLEVHHTRRIAELYAAEQGLCFGRVDTADGERQYVGRIALADDDHEPLLTDWRAPAAEPFYRATPAAPGPVVARRHLRTSGRTVVGFDDDAFGVAAQDQDPAQLSGESALLASLTAARTGRMGDIVSTIQAEQDRIIRSDLAGVLVVQGGPGTGKTVVALHRAAYLLYTHRDRLAGSGVLVVGPNATFLRYIDQVLPALGESDVLLSSVGTLYPGVTATATEPPEAEAAKGDARMAQVLAAALDAHRRPPEQPHTLTVDLGQRRREEIQVSPATCERAQAAARRTGEPHNQARAELVSHLSSELALRIARDRGGKLDLDAAADLADALVTEPAFQALVERLWPHLTPEHLLTDLFGSADRLAAAAPHLTAAQRAALLRGGDREPTWTTADVPLLDEAAELLGPLPGATTRRAAPDAREREFAEAVLESVTAGMNGAGRIDAGLLLDQYRGNDAVRPLTERAAADRTWAFGHVIVDEAQELSPMAWRLLARRCPGRSMTIVGDLAQTGTPAGPNSWNEVLDAYAAGRWRTAELTVNYRTPAEIVHTSAGVLHAVDPSLTVPRAARHGGARPWSLRLPADTRGPALRTAVEREAAALGAGRMAVIHAPGAAAELRAALAGTDGVAVAGHPSALDSPVVLMTAGQSKGLEFDVVLVVEPAEIVTAHPRGVNDLYVALTRATRSLGVLHAGELPQMLGGLAELPV